MSTTEPKPRRRVDLLQNEADRGRLSPMALAAGRSIEDALASPHRSGGSTWGERVDTSRQTDAAAIHGLEAARQVERTMVRVAAVVGAMDARLVRRILGDRVSFEDCAALEGKAGARGTGYVAARFRDALEELAASMKVVGSPSIKINDRCTQKRAASSADLC